MQFLVNFINSHLPFWGWGLLQEILDPPLRPVLKPTSIQILTHIHTYLGDRDLLLHNDPRKDHTENHDGSPVQTPHRPERGEFDRGEEARVKADSEEGDDHVADDLFLRAQPGHLSPARTQ